MRNPLGAGDSGKVARAYHGRLISGRFGTRSKSEQVFTPVNSCCCVPLDALTIIASTLLLVLHVDVVENVPTIALLTRSVTITALPVLRPGCSSDAHTSDARTAGITRWRCIC